MSPTGNRLTPASGRAPGTQRERSTAGRATARSGVLSAVRWPRARPRSRSGISDDDGRWGVARLVAQREAERRAAADPSGTDDRPAEASTDVASEDVVPAADSPVPTSDVPEPDGDARPDDDGSPGTAAPDDGPAIAADLALAAPADNVSALPDDSAPAVPDDSAPAVPDDSAPAVPGDSAPAVPGDSAPTVPDDGAPTASDDGASALPDGSAVAASDAARGPASSADHVPAHVAGRDPDAESVDVTGAVAVVETPERTSADDEPARTPGPPAPRAPEPAVPPSPRTPLRTPLVPRPPLPSPRRPPVVRTGPVVPNAADSRASRPRVEPDPSLFGFARHTRSRLGARVFTLFFVLVFAFILIQTIASIV